MIIVDTNILVTGLITSTASAKTVQIVDAMVRGQLRPLMSPALLDEYRAVLLRPRIADRHGLNANQIDELLSAIVQHAVWRTPQPAVNSAPDPGDNLLWALLEAEPTSTLVTGDTRLLNIPPFETRVMSVAAYQWHVH